MSNVLQTLLDRVKEDDLKKFREVIEQKEVASEKHLKDQGLLNIDGVMGDKIHSLNMSESGLSEKFTDDDEIVKEEDTTDKSSEDVFNKFMQTIRG